MTIKGFFTNEELRLQTSYDFLKNESSFPSCKKCGFDKDCQNPRMRYYGKGKKKILIVDERPHFQEDEANKPLIRSIGDDLKDAFHEYGINVDKDCWTTHALACFIAKEKIPNEKITCCRPLLMSTIKKLKPKYIILLGDISIKSFYSKIFTKPEISQFRGFIFKDRMHEAFVLPILSLSIFDRQYDRNTHSVFDRDIKKALKFINKNKKFPEFKNDENKIKCLYRYADVLLLLNNIIKKQPEFLAFDYEGTSLKPFRPGNKITSISLCFEKSKAYSFPLEYQDYWTNEQIIKIKGKWKKILLSKNIKKIAHNLKFEDVWTNVILKHKVNNWFHCTMNFAHILDNRKKITSLDFQTYLNFGRYPYSGKVKKYLEAEKIFNRVDECPLEDLLLYGGLDSLYTFWLFLKQYKERDQYKEAYNLFHEGLKEFSIIQQTGICVDEEYYHNIDNLLLKRIEKLNQKLSFSKEAKRFKKKIKREIDFKSPKDLGILFYDILKCDKLYTAKNNYKVDEKALLATKTKIAKKLIKVRKLTKIKDTYLAQFIRESFNGRMHPFLDLHIPVSFRSCSSRPNAQNVPKRYELAKRYCRSGIIPSLGNQLLEWDFSGVEVGTGCCYHYDPVMIKYLTVGGDMHTDSAVDIWQLSKKDVSDKIRFFAKNCWTFPQFYGSKYTQCAANLWETCINLKTNKGIILKDHMRSLGIKDLKQFTDYLQKAEDIFWNKRFVVYRDWKKDINEFYIRKGYIETHLGFRMSGIMGPNDTTNYQIQGTAFHILLYTLIQVARIGRKRNWKSKFITQIHDAGTQDLYPPELEEIMEVVNHIVSNKIPERFPWINVPLKVDFEITPINGSWFEKEKLKLVA